MSMRHENGAPIRLVFELARAQNPRLYDELVQFQKGTRRVNRLRVLAYDGLLAQNGAFGRGLAQAVAASAERPAATATALTNDVFQPGLAE